MFLLLNVLSALEGTFEDFIICYTEKLARPVNVRLFAVKAKMYGVIYNQSSSIAFDCETSNYRSALKTS